MRAHVRKTNSELGAPAGPAEGDAGSTIPAVEPPSKRAPTGGPQPGLLAPLLVAVLLTLTFVTIPPAPLHLDEDPSLSGLLNYVHQHGLQFGTDMVSTYGPLGYLIFPFFWAQDGALRMATDVGLCFGVALGLCLLAWRLELGWRCLLLLLVAFLWPSIQPRHDLVLETGLLGWGLLCVVERGWRLVACSFILTALAVFAALAKVSFLLLGGLTVGAIALDLSLRGRWWLGLLLPAGLAAGFVLGWIAAGESAANLPAFFHNTLATVRDYEQAVVMQPLATVSRRAFGCVLLVLAGVLTRTLGAFEREEPRRYWRRALVMCWLGALLFLVWKHGFVRADSWHMLFFLGFAPVLAAAVEVLPCERATRRQWARGFAAAGCVLCVVTVQTMFFPPWRQALAQPWAAIASNLRCLMWPAEYRQRMMSLLAANQQEAQLPRLRRVVGRQTVDVFGQYQAYALFNDVNYRPRPVAQSYAAWDEALMRLNSEFYLSKAAPDYVWFALFVIDHRLPALEDALLLRHLLINYELVAAEGTFLLLKAKSAVEPKLTLLREEAVPLGQPIDLTSYPRDNLWLEVNTSLSQWGKVRAFFYQPPIMRLAVWRAPSQGRFNRLRAPPPMMAAGFLASPLLLHNEDVEGLYRGKPLTRPGAYSLEVAPGEAALWQKTAQVRIYRLENPLGGSSAAESTPPKPD